MNAQDTKTSPISQHIALLQFEDKHLHLITVAMAEIAQKADNFSDGEEKEVHEFLYCIYLEMKNAKAL